jgi:ATP-dependent Clp protease ATP-binding subunit ClpA
MNVDIIQLEVDEQTVRREPVSTSVELPLTDATRHVLEFAAEEADTLGHTYIGAEHLFLGLLREESSLVGSILRTNGFDLMRARSQIVEFLEAPAKERPDNAEIIQEIEHLKRLVERLARMVPDQPAARPLLEQITFRLNHLHDRFSV